MDKTSRVCIRCPSNLVYMYSPKHKDDPYESKGGSRKTVWRGPGHTSAGGLGGAVSPPAGFGAEPRKLLRFSASKLLRMHFRDQKYRDFQKNVYIIVKKNMLTFVKNFVWGGGASPPCPPLGSASGCAYAENRGI